MDTWKYPVLAGLLYLLTASAGAQHKMEKPAPWVGQTLQGAPCKGQDMRAGPWDYLQRNSYHSELAITESYHFTAEIENLTAKHETLPNIAYTLRAWPNHHRALYAMIRASKMRGTDLGQHKSKTPVECYLQRAVNFSRQDSTTRMLFAMYLQGIDQNETALEQYRIAEKLDPTNLQLKYNLALLLVDMGRYAEAGEYARDVYARDFPMPGLRDMLEDAGHWSPPEQASEDSEGE